MILAKTYQKLSKFVNVTAKILSVLFSEHGVGLHWISFAVESRTEYLRLNQSKT